MDHPNILKMYNLYQDDSYFYIGKLAEIITISTSLMSHVSYGTVKVSGKTSMISCFLALSSSRCSICNFSTVTDVYKGGELFDEIIKRTKFTEDDAADLINHLLSCINYCHKQHLVHRDLKPENILLEENMEMDDMKVIDFGLAGNFVDGQKMRESV